ncbi:MAG: hypothetical protein ACKVVP_03305 [Chloroflexota bacterium]
MLWRSLSATVLLVSTVLSVAAQSQGTSAVWSPITMADAPPPSYGHTAIWTGTEMLVFGGRDEFAGRYDPQLDRWRPMSLEGATMPSYNLVKGVWTGTQMLVWARVIRPEPRGRIGRYDPQLDRWVPVSTLGAPSLRLPAALVWTGRYVIAWGEANDGGEMTSEGGLYDPNTDTWVATAVEGAPSPRRGSAAVWTGSEMLVLGGAGPAETSALGGAALDPVTNTWRPLSALDSSGRALRWGCIVGCSPVWTGSRMLSWVGRIGYAYDPATDTSATISTITGVDGWQHTPPSRGASAVWTGRELMIWGGIGGERFPWIYDVGARYDPETDTWSPIAGSGRPTPRYSHSGVWDGEAMIVWGGVAGDQRSPAEGGARYRPLWLTVLSSTLRTAEDGQEFGPTDAGDVYRVIDVVSNRALVQFLGDPPSVQSWITVDDRVRITAVFPSGE